MKRPHRQLLIQGIAQLEGVAFGLNQSERDALASRWGDRGPERPEGIAYVAAPPRLAQEANRRREWSEETIISQAAYAMRMAARALDDYGWRSAEFASALSNRTVPATDARRSASTAKRARARALRLEGRSVAQIALAMKVQPRTVERYLAPEKTPTDRRTVGQDDDPSG